MSILVTGATGGQGGETARQLLAAGQPVTAFVRDPSKPAAQELAQLGARIVQGDFSDTAALSEASKGCRAVFLNTSSPGDEAQFARNVVAAAQEHGLQQIVCSTAVGIENWKTLPGLDHLTFMQPFFAGKEGVQQAVQTSGLAHWTILQPAWLMTNFVPPSSRAGWPELAGEHVLLTAAPPGADFDLTDPADVGRFAAKAFQEPTNALLDKQIVPVSSECLRMEQIAEIMSDVAGTPVTLRHHDPAHAAELAKTSVFSWSQRTFAEGHWDVSAEHMQRFDIKRSTLRDFLVRKKADLAAALTPESSS